MATTVPRRVILELPWPPSWNHMYGQTRQGTRYMKKPGLLFKQAVKDLLKENYPKHRTFKKPVFLEMDIYLPDKRRRDSSNILKIVEDACTEAGIWQDDELVHIHRMNKVGYCMGGAVKVCIGEIV